MTETVPVGGAGSVELTIRRQPAEPGSNHEPRSQRSNTPGKGQPRRHPAIERDGHGRLATPPYFRARPSRSPGSAGTMRQVSDGHARLTDAAPVVSAGRTPLCHPVQARRRAGSAGVVSEQSIPSRTSRPPVEAVACSSTSTRPHHPVPSPRSSPAPAARIGSRAHHPPPPPAASPRRVSRSPAQPAPPPVRSADAPYTRAHPTRCHTADHRPSFAYGCSGRGVRTIYASCAPISTACRWCP